MRKLLLLIAFALGPTVSSATNITLQGHFTADDDLQLFSVFLSAPASVDFRSYGYGGGTTSTGLVVPRGGFDTILTLFTGSGLFIDDNDDGAGAAIDPTTGLAADARITANLAAGTYILALTQFDNFSIGDLADGFAETGHPNFTADPTFATGGPCPGNVFRDVSGTAGRCRSGNWTVDFLNVSSVTAVLPVPEPPTLLLIGVGLALLLAIRRLGPRRRDSVFALGLAATLAGASLHAQTPPPPDYSNVNDFLNGQRTVINFTDIQIFRQNNYPNYENFDTRSNILQVQTSNSAQTLNQSNLFPINELSTFSSDASKPNLSFSAHMFNQASASTLTTLSNFQGSGTLALWLQNVDRLQGGPGWWTPIPNDNPITTSGAVADFTGDGYDDLALSFADGRLLVLAPNDTSDVFSNFKSAIVPVDVLSAIVAGDFNGTLQRQIAGLNIQSNGSVKLEIFTVDPTSLTPTLATSFPITMPSGVSPANPVTQVAIAKGRFNSAGHDQLVVAFATAPGPTIVEIVDFAANTLNPFEGPPLTVSTTGVPVGYLQVQTAKFGLATNVGAPTNPYDQIIFHMSSVSVNSRFFQPITADSATLALTAHSGVTYDQYPCAAGIAVGNFGNTLPDPTPSNPNQTKPNLNSQIALLYCNNENPFNPQDTGFNAYTLNFYNVDSNFNIPTTPVSALDLTNQLWVNSEAAMAVNLVATDLQGRSITLGEPTKITVKSAAQPIAIIGVPPMHIDWISPTVGAAPSLTDVSYIWTGYNTTYQQENTTSNGSTSTNTTSWSFGAAESGTTSVTIGDPDDGDGLSISDTAKAAQDIKQSSTATHGVFTGTMFSSSKTTGIDDIVFHVNADFTIWTYPVIGKTVCPNGAPNCAQPVPLTLQYSAANGNPMVTPDEGATLTWYQPPWEPGNIFSYPATTQSPTSYGQLSVLFPNLAMLAPGDPYETSTTASVSQSSWQNSSTTTASAGLNQNFSFDNNFSVSGQIGIEGLSVGVGADLDVNGSTGFDNLTERTTTIGSSTGITVNVPGVFRDPVNYGYNVTPYIIGFQPPAGTVDNQQVGGNVKASGFMTALYTWSPQGSWWQVYKQAPDIALNHPSRWTQGYGNLPDNNAPTPFPCLNPGGGQYLECPSLNTPTPNVPANDDFHYLRGLFISSASSPGQGPQLEQAAVGQQLSLQARVYNYSLAAMSAGAQAMAAFYVAPWDADNAPAQAVLVNQPVKLPAIPAFDPTSGTTVNWLLTPPVVFDPSDPKYQSVIAPTNSVMFYVVVWMQDSAGNLITEMPAHGFTARQVSATPSLSEWIANEETYSNNVGLFYQEISILQPPSPRALLGRPAPEAPLAIGKIDVSANRANLGNPVLLTTMLVPSDETSGVTVNFYDGDPKNNGRMFREVRIPYMAPNAPHRVRTTFRPRDCGTRQLFAVVNRGKASEIVRSAPPVRVACLPPLASAMGSRPSR